MIAALHPVPPRRIRVTNCKGNVTFLVLPRGLRGTALAMLLGGLAAGAIFGGLVLLILRHDGLPGTLRAVGAGAVGVAGLCFVTVLVSLALQDAKARASLTLDDDALTVRQSGVFRKTTQHWPRSELRSITAGLHRSRERLGAPFLEPIPVVARVLRIILASGERVVVLGGCGLDAELPWLAAALRESLGMPDIGLVWVADESDGLS
jgi:hypothetical protein